LRALGVLYGYGSRDELARAGAHGLCAVPADIPEVAVRG
jgi:phosphoglycolate phosphatase